jgi:hypothetical protein
MNTQWLVMFNNMVGSKWSMVCCWSSMIGNWMVRSWMSMIAGWGMVNGWCLVVSGWMGMIGGDWRWGMVSCDWGWGDQFGGYWSVIDCWSVGNNRCVGNNGCCVISLDDWSWHYFSNGGWNNLSENLGWLNNLGNNWGWHYFSWCTVEGFGDMGVETVDWIWGVIYSASWTIRFDEGVLK